MTTKNKKDLSKEVNEDLTAAGKSIQAKPSAASKASMMASAITAMGSMDSDECSQWLDKALALIGHEADSAPDSSAQNAASVAMKGDAKSATIPSMEKAIKEDVEALFGSEALSEEFKQKTAVLFESAVSARVNIVVAELQEAAKEAVEEQIAEAIEELIEQTDKYLTHAVNQWATDNEVAIENSLKSELAEDFIAGIINLAQEHNFVLPEAKIDVVEALAEKVDQLESQLNEQMNANIELNSLLEQHNKEQVFKQVTEGLALTQVEKLRTLSEGVESDGDAKAFKKKLEIIKEHHFGVKGKPTLINEQNDSDDSDSDQSTARYLEPQIRNYVDGISRTIKR